MELEVLAEKRDDRGRLRWFIECPNCGKKRWAHICQTRIPTFTGLCSECWRASHMVKGEKSIAWRGSRKVIKAGYIKIRLLPTDFFYPMVAQDGYVTEHRLVVAKALGRCLHRWEIVHHKGVKYPKGSVENKQDNRYPENLQLTTDEHHKQITILENRIAQLEKRVTILEAENALLKSEVQV